MPSADRISLLRDADGDGVAETRTTFLEGLHSPFGMALVNGDFYVANSDAVVRFPYAGGEMRIAAAGSKLVDLPAGPINHHWTKNLIASRDGARSCTRRWDQQQRWRARHRSRGGPGGDLEIDRKTGVHSIFASGCATDRGWRSSPRPARCGRSSTSATSWAAIWSPTP